MLVSAQEPDFLKALGTFSPYCEQLGADIVFLTTQGEVVAIQRKAIHDLVSSLGERLNRELLKMAPANVKVMLIEGEWRWTADGESLALRAQSPFKRKNYDGLVRAFHHDGFWVVTTDSLAHTAEWLVCAEDWFNHRQHTSLSTRPNPPKDMFGTRDSEGTRLWWWQWFEGLGAVQAKELDAHFHGELPVTWTMERDEFLAEVQGCRGIGKKRAEKMWTQLMGTGK